MNVVYNSIEGHRLIKLTTPKIMEESAEYESSTKNVIRLLNSMQIIEIDNTASGHMTPPTLRENMHS